MFNEKKKIEFLYLNQNDLFESGCFDSVWATEVVEESIKDYAFGQVSFPIKTVQRIRPEEGDRVNCLPAVNFAKGVAGVKWVSVFPANPTRREHQNLTAIIILTELDTGMPLAVMDGTLCSNMRTAAITTIAARKLACSSPRRLVIFGAGEQSKMHIIFLVRAFPSLSVFHVSTRSAHTAAKFVAEMRRLFPNLEFTETGEHTDKVVKQADIVITATSSQGPHLKADWLKEGLFYSHIGGWEDEFDVVRRCDKIVCDDWAHVKHGSQTLAQMYQDHLIDDDTIYADLTDLVTGKKKGRSAATERIYFNAIGLSYADVTLAHAMYKRASKHRRGQRLTLQSDVAAAHQQIMKEGI